MKISRSMLSPISPSSGSSGSGAAASRRTPSSSCFRPGVFSAAGVEGRCFAVAISQAPGFSGMPAAGHCSSAATSASCARSSARPTSRTIRSGRRSVRPLRCARPRRWQDGCRGPPWPPITPSSRGRAKPVLLPRSVLHLLEAFHRLLRLGREIVELLHLADFDDLVVAHRRAAGPLQRFRLRLHLDHQ